MKFKQTAYQDIANIIEEAIDEEVKMKNDSIVKLFESIDSKLMGFFDE